MDDSEEEYDEELLEEFISLSIANNETSSYPIYGLMENKTGFKFPYLYKKSQHNQVSPIKILQNKEILSISCTETVIYFLTKDNEIYTFNKSSSDSDTENNNLNHFPFRVKMSSNDELTNKFEKSVIQLECGKSSVLFLTKEGLVFGYGSNHRNVLGFNRNNFNTIEDYPKEIPELKDIIQIKAGVNHSLFLNRNYEIFACGDDEYYQTGPNSNNTDGLICKIIIHGLKHNEHVLNMICGGYHNFFITNLNNVFCNGNNGQYQLGVYSSSVQDVSYFLENEKFNIKKVACGCNHTIFLTNEHRVYGLGFNLYFQLGSPSEFKVKKPKEFNFSFKKENEYIIDVACGMNHSLFVSNLGNVYGVGNAGSFCLPKEKSQKPFHLGLPLLGHNECWKLFSGLYFNGTFFVKTKTSKNLLLFFSRLKESIVNHLLLSDIDIN
ncbi:hypothetical protein ABK040_012318 [Willaertia magna]